MLVIVWFHMETNRLQQFCVIVETENMRRAADLLHLSHSALSKSMGVLQAELGVRLLMPEGRGIAVTEAGRRLYQRAKELLGQVERFCDEARGQTERRPIFRIATFEVFSTYFLSHWLTARAGTAKDKDAALAEFLVREATPGRMEELVVAGEADCGLTYIPIPHRELILDQVATIDMGLFGRRDRFSGRKLNELPFAAPSIPVEGAPTRVRGLDGWPDDRVPRQVPYQVDMLETALALARSGLAVAWLPKFVVRLHNQQLAEEFRLAALQPAGLPKVEPHPVYLMRKKSVPESPLYRSLASALRRLGS